MEFFLAVFSLIVGTAALFASLVAIAVGLTGGDVAKTLGLCEAQELPEIKRKTARCLMLVVAWGSLFVLATIPVAVWTTLHLHDNPIASPPWWFTVWMLIGFATGVYVLQIVGLLFQFAALLRERNTLTVWQTLLLLSSAVTGNSVTLYRRKGHDDHRI